ncbi:MAG: DMT family transporter [Francisellaceae bacterium]|jgi:drug/metabolite transporter (DMT)-like permease|nr:DMT family transporter [Francisellaceae bacterium]MBT6208296.1 DMT family transporter [Francisellaceae bacterium]MBT6538653.1 DMT family transporter [Francisellaceae bacterium]
MNQKYLGFVQMIVAQIGVGVSVVVGKQLMQDDVSVLTQVEARFIFCSMFLIINFIPALLYKHLRGCASDYALKLNKKQWAVLVAQSLCGGIFFNLIMLAGLRYTTATMAGILTSTLPAILAILSYFILKERIGGQRIFAIMLAIVGIIVLHLDSAGDGSHAKNAMLGGFLIILSMVPEALYTVLAKKLGNVVNPLVQALAINIISTVVFLPFWFYYIGFDNLVEINSDNLTKMVATGFLSYLFFYLWTAGVTKVPASVAAIFTGIMPIATTIGAISLMGESFTMYDAAGMCFVLFSIFIGSGVVVLKNPMKKNNAEKE